MEERGRSLLLPSTPHIIAGWPPTAPTRDASLLHPLLFRDDKKRRGRERRREGSARCDAQSIT